MGLNLHGIVRAAIQSVNPDTLCIWQQSIGYRTLPDGSQATNYNNVWNVPVQVQGLSSGDLKQINYLNLEGILRKIYMFGSVDGVVRAAMKGGDLLVFPDFTPQAVLDSSKSFIRDSNGQVVVWFPQRFWKIVQVMERWPGVTERGWSSAIVCQQTLSTNFVIDSDGEIAVDSWGNLLVASE